jgi:hypothetical protein
VSTRLVAAFRGAAQCRRRAGPIHWVLAGVDREGGSALEVMVCGAPALALPAELPDAELHEDAAGESTSWVLRSEGRVIPTGARAVQVHRDAAAAFASVLPRFGVPWTVRLGWLMLLTLLRLPGAARLLGWLRSRGAR